MSNSEAKNMIISSENDENKSSQAPTKSSYAPTKRNRKERKYYHNENFTPYQRTKKQSNTNDTTDNTDNTSNDMVEPNLPTEDEMRERNVEKITSIFREYIEGTLDAANLPIDRENSRVTAFVKSMKNSFSLKKKVYISNNMGFLVSSSDGKQTYNVQPKAIADTLKYMCNCGTNYQDSERTSCKHCGAVLFYNFDNYFSDYLNSKQNVTLQLYHLQKKLGKVDFEEVEKPDKMKITKPLKDVSIEKELKKDDTDFFSFVLKNKSC